MSFKWPQPLKAIWNFFASVKLAIVLLIILAAAALLGTLLTQGQPPAFYLARHGEVWARFILAWQLDNLYASFWFLALLAALAVNLIVCSLNRLPKTLNIIFDRPDPARLRLPKVELRREMTLEAEADETLAAARRLAAKLGRVTESSAAQPPGKVCLYAHAGRLSRLAPYLIHLAILILFAAGLTTAVWGFKGYVTLVEGETADSLTLRPSNKDRPLGFQVRLDRFEIETYPNGTPKLYRSNLTFLKDDHPVEKAQVIVNGPATFGGVTFYQSHYGKELGEWVEVEINPAHGEKKILRLPTSGEKKVAGLGRFKVFGFESDLRGLGPALRLGFWREGAPDPEIFWVLTKPPFQMRPSSPEVFRLAGFDGKYYSGLQANYDPGVWLVWLGGALLLIGLAAAFFWSHRRFWIETEPSGDQMKIILAGATNRNRPAFEQQFARLADELEEMLIKSSQRKSQ